MKKLSCILLAAATAAALAACGAGSEPGGSTRPTGSEAPAAEPLPSPTVTPEPIQLAVRKATVKGVEADIVTINGRTAYRFEVDEDEPPTVNCLYDCLVTWPPALSDGSKIRATGIDPSLVGTVRRADGGIQATLAGWPLYRFEEDLGPNDVKGEGVGNNWSVVRPDGKPVIRKNPLATPSGEPAEVQ
jgi:predicted lipoprotein with Yx(FWY)xxD motif